MKVLRLSLQSKYLLFFILFSLVFVYMAWCLGNGISAFQLQSLTDFLKTYIILVAFVPLLMRSIYKSHGVSVKILSFYLIATSVVALVQLGRSTNKLVLVAAFIYAIYAIYYYYQWSLESEMAAYTPNFSKFDLDKSKRFHLLVNVQTKNGEFTGRLTNLDENSLFVRFDKEVHLENLEEVSLKSVLDEVAFHAKGKVCTYFDQGYGIVVEDFAQDRFSWKQFYSIISERAWS